MNRFWEKLVPDILMDNKQESMNSQDLPSGGPKKDYDKLNYLLPVEIIDKLIKHFIFCFIPFSNFLL